MLLLLNSAGVSPVFNWQSWLKWGFLSVMLASMAAVGFYAFKPVATDVPSSGQAAAPSLGDIRTLRLSQTRDGGNWFRLEAERAMDAPVKLGFARTSMLHLFKVANIEFDCVTDEMGPIHLIATAGNMTGDMKKLRITGPITGKLGDTSIFSAGAARINLESGLIRLKDVGISDGNGLRQTFIDTVWNMRPADMQMGHR